MSKEDLMSQILNLNPPGGELLSKFIKEELKTDSELEADKRKYTSMDGYQSGLINMNLNTFIRLKSSLDKLDGNSLNEKEMIFLESIEILIKEQHSLIEKGFKKLSEVLKVYLKGPSGDNFKLNVFKDFSKYTII